MMSDWLDLCVLVFPKHAMSAEEVPLPAQTCGRRPTSATQFYQVPNIGRVGGHDLQARPPDDTHTHPPPPLIIAL